MVCHVVRFQNKGEADARWGVLENEVVFPLSGTYDSTSAFIREGKSEAMAVCADSSKTGGLPYDGLTLLSPITKPCQVLCQGANYVSHMIDSGMNPDDKKFNMFFHKSAASITGPAGDIVKPDHVRLLDYEVELGLVIGEEITESVRVDDSNLATHVAGIVIGNDISARDVQIPEMQFFKGKSYRSFCPVGPVLCLLEKDEIRYLNEMKLTLSVNGELRQKDTTRNLVFKPAETLTELSQITDMHTGDLVLTGTPAGCALRIPSPVVAKIGALLPEPVKWKMFKKTQAKRKEYLRPGDVLRTSISSEDGVINLGVQENRVV